MPQISTSDLYVVYQQWDIDNTFPLCFDNEPEAKTFADELNVRYSYTDDQSMDIYKVCSLSNYIFKYGNNQYTEGYSCGNISGYEDGRNDY